MNGNFVNIAWGCETKYEWAHQTGEYHRLMATMMKMMAMAMMAAGSDLNTLRNSDQISFYLNKEDDNTIGKMI